MAQCSHIEVDTLVIGAGPAGIQVGYYLEKAGRNYLIVEAGKSVGTFYTKFPRHRQLISINKWYTGYDCPETRMRFDWNSLLSDEYSPLFGELTKQYFPSADFLTEYCGKFVEQHNIKVRCQTRLTQITRPVPGGNFVATDENGNTFTAKRVVVATGVTKPNVPEFEGAELCELYYNFVTDPETFNNQRVLIVGRGNSAFETADALTPHAAVIHVQGKGSLKLAWRTHFVGHLRAVNNNFLDTYQLKSQNALLDGSIVNVRKTEKGYYVNVCFERFNNVVKEIFYDRVILCSGFRWDDTIFAPECRPETVIRKRFPNQTEQWESINVPDVYFAGTITQMRDFKQSTSGFIHGFRYACRALFKILENKYYNVPYPVKDLGTDIETAVSEIVRRVSTSSCLWQQFAFLGDVLLVGPDGSMRFTEELPMDLTQLIVPRGELGDVDKFATIDLEYGADHHVKDPFDVTEVNLDANGNMTALDGRYLHPVLRMYCGKTGEQISEHHMVENLENEWDSEARHREPLRKWLKELLPAPTASLPRVATRSMGHDCGCPYQRELMQIKEQRKAARMAAETPASPLAA